MHLYELQLEYSFTEVDKGEQCLLDTYGSTSRLVFAENEDEARAIAKKDESDEHLAPLWESSALAWEYPIVKGIVKGIVNV
jgi:hypothetical protein